MSVGCGKNKGIGDFFIDQFSNLFRVEDVSHCPYLDSLIQKEITLSDNDRITAIPSKVKISDVINSFNHVRALGSDGMSVLQLLKLSKMLLLLGEC